MWWFLLGLEISTVLPVSLLSRKSELVEQEKGRQSGLKESLDQSKASFSWKGQVWIPCATKRRWEDSTLYSSTQIASKVDWVKPQLGWGSSGRHLGKIGFDFDTPANNVSFSSTLIQVNSATRSRDEFSQPEKLKFSDFLEFQYKVWISKKPDFEFQPYMYLKY